MAKAKANVVHGWTVEHDVDADGMPVCVLTKPDRQPVMVWGRVGTDPSILEERGVVEALAEDVRLAPPDDIDAAKARHEQAYAQSQRNKRLRMMDAADAAKENA